MRYVLFDNECDAANSVAASGERDWLANRSCGADNTHAGKVMDHVKYCAGYKFQVVEDYSVDVGFKPPLTVAVGEWVSLSDQGILTAKAGYAWDGASGPIEQTPDVIRGSLVHDCLYQLMRAGLLDQSYREQADDVLKRICIEDGMSHWYAQIVFNAVREFGASAAAVGAQPYPVLTAP